MAESASAYYQKRMSKSKIDHLAVTLPGLSRLGWSGYVATARPHPSSRASLWPGVFPPGFDHAGHARFPGG
jgi:hypothetical protein